MKKLLIKAIEAWPQQIPLSGAQVRGTKVQVQARGRQSSEAKAQIIAAGFRSDAGGWWTFLGVSPQDVFSAH
jgi:hypothetical protein